MVQTNAFVDAPDNPPLVIATPADCWGSDFSLPSTVVIEQELEGVPIMPLDDPNELDEQRHQESVTMGAGVAAGVVGLLVGGPVLAILTGFGTAYATKLTGASGDTARAIGQIALETRTKAIELDRQHNLVQKGRDAVATTWEKAKEFDRTHNVLEKSKAFLVWSWEAIQEQNRKHNLLERAVNATGKLVAFVVTKIAKSCQSDEPTPTPTLTNQPTQSSPPPPVNPNYTKARNGAQQPARYPVVIN
jgi:hypothetical protein